MFCDHRHSGSPIILIHTQSLVISFGQQLVVGFYHSSIRFDFFHTQVPFSTYSAIFLEGSSRETTSHSLRRCWYCRLSFKCCKPIYWPHLEFGFLCQNLKSPHKAPIQKILFRDGGVSCDAYDVLCCLYIELSLMPLLPICLSCGSLSRTLLDGLLLLFEVVVSPLLYLWICHFVGYIATSHFVIAFQCIMDFFWPWSAMKLMYLPFSFYLRVQKSSKWWSLDFHRQTSIPCVFEALIKTDYNPF